MAEIVEKLLTIGGALIIGGAAVIIADHFRKK